ncbi:MAG: AAA family ATPase [Cryomorphaceae bacterium]|nr:AAA family ATPase [Cryomorphaceae bacterium]
MQNLIQEYKAIIAETQMKDELYKWELISKYHGRPNVNADDFAKEYESINFSNLVYRLTAAVGNHICKEKSEEFRRLFRALFDESIPLEKRIHDFDTKSLALYRSVDGNNSHHQDERAIATYLTYHNPLKYSFYQSTAYTRLCKYLGLKAKTKGKKYVHYLELLNTLVKEYIARDVELLNMVNNIVPSDVFNDKNHMLLAQDIVYQTMMKDEVIANYNTENAVKYWVFAPGQNASKWDEFYEQGIMGLGWDNLGDLTQFDTKEEIEKRLKELENTKKSKKNDANANFDFYKSISIGDIIIAKKGRSEYLGYGIVTSDYFYDKQRNDYRKVRKVDWKKRGHWDEPDKDVVLKTLTDITKYPNYVNKLIKLLGIEEEYEEKKSNHPLNQILYGPPGTGKTYTLKTKYFDRYITKETALTKEEYFEEVVRGLTWWQVVALALLEKNNQKVSDLVENHWVAHKSKISESKNVRATLWGTLQMHTIQESETVAYTQRLAPLIFDKNKDKTWQIMEDDVKEQTPELIDILEDYQNFKPNPDNIIQRYVFTTFHQSFSYEDFIEGIKPVISEIESGNSVQYKIEDGVFKELCRRAASDPNNRYAIFIDEINRGNVSAIFGELITLIETDKRKGAENSLSATLPYSKSLFTVPSNVDIYGTMNTADRSVEALDTALRRRFSFVEMMPNPSLLKQNADHQGIIEGIDLADVLQTINDRIEVLVDRDHTIGHSYFLKVNNSADLKNAFKDKIIPLLQEYFFGDYGKMEMVIGAYFFEEKKDKVSFAVQQHNYYDLPKRYLLKDLSSEDFDIIQAMRGLLCISTAQ